ncbi:MAG: glycosyltransferase [Nitrospirae bacterium]|nr:glycosyltransferase [Nitrospirota bacterium]
MNKISATLVTTCYNEISSVTNWISDINTQTKHIEDICIVDAGSTDGTLEILKTWVKGETRIRMIVSEKCNVAQGRNKAIGMANSDIIVSTDMGCRLDSNWFQKLLEPFEKDSSTDVVAGNYGVDESTIETPVAMAACYIFNNYSPILKDGFLPSSRSIAYRRRVWEELKGYPEDLTLAGDDTVFALQIIAARYNVYYAKDAICYWGRPNELRKYWKEAFIYGLGNGEAGIFPLRYGAQPWKILWHYDALKQATISSRRIIFKAFSNGDILAAFIIPILKYGYIINSYKGYAIGVVRGAYNCLNTRNKRLKGSAK